MKLIKKYRSHFIYQLAGLIFLILLFMLCSYFLVIRYSTNLMRQNTLDMNEKLLAQTENHILEYWDTLYNVATAFCYSPTTLQYLSGDSLSRLPESDELASVFSNTLLLNDTILSAYLYNNDLTQVAAMGKEFSLSSDDIEICPAMEIHAEPLNGNDALYYEVLYPIYNLESTQYQDILGICIFILEPGSLDDVLLDAQATENSQVFLLDASDRILTCTDKSFRSPVFSKEAQKSGRSHYFYSHTLSLNEWKIASLIPEKDLNRPDRTFHYITAAVFLISLLLLGVLFIYYNLRITLPIQRITEFIQNINTAPEERISLNRQDEVGVVANSLNQMLDENQALQKEIMQSQKRIYEAELAIKQAELLAYRNQINPHFLYNTFECIRGMALYHGKEDIAEITMALSNVFRFAIKGNDIVSVEEEVNHILEYATIIEYRFMGKISIDVTADETVRKKKVFKLMLQPLVENAVFHGLEQKMTDGLVDVTITSPDDSHLCFVVEDDGCGIAPYKLKDILNQLDDYENTSKVGLFNIYQRLKLFYEDQFTFRIDSEQGKGTRITILIPDDISEITHTGGDEHDRLYRG